MIHIYIIIIIFFFLLKTIIGVSLDQDIEHVFYLYSQLGQ